MPSDLLEPRTRDLRGQVRRMLAPAASSCQHSAASLEAMPKSRRLRLSRRTRPFQESVIREMTRLHAEVGGVNLAQGLPDFEPPRELLEALRGAIASPENHQYGFTWGLPAPRGAGARKTERRKPIPADPEDKGEAPAGV